MRLFYLLALFAIAACDELPRNNNLEQSYGGQNSLTVIMDTSNCPDSVYKYLFTSLSKDFPGVSQKSPGYSVHNRYDNMNGKSKEHQLQIYINDLEDSTKTGIENKILLQSICRECDSFPCIKIVQDKWALNQTIVAITVNNLSELNPFYKANESLIFEACEAQVLNSYKNTMMYLDYFSDTIELHLKANKPRIITSNEFQTVTKSDGLCWIRKSGEQYEESIIVWSVPFYHDSLLNSDLIVHLKDSISDNEKVLFDGIRDIKVEKRIPLRLKRTKLNDIFVLEAMGQWKMKSQTGVGGTFISYIIPISKEKGSIYLEGFLYDPGPKESESIRKLKIILNTLEINTNG